ncbi:hypothetical protein C6503_21325 [Candidatus Poribacteria bacterium]|nr:MAG: hypothetical protein C6503_21325 [Candidatus Poribacteria bacterium]
MRLGGKSAEIPKQYAEIPKQKHTQQKHRTYRAWGEDSIGKWRIEWLYIGRKKPCKIRPDLLDYIS